MATIPENGKFYWVIKQKDYGPAVGIEFAWYAALYYDDKWYVACNNNPVYNYSIWDHVGPEIQFPMEYAEKFRLETMAAKNK